ncbi:fatty acid desaturase-domain-containing protein [Pseudomassariella vexata]|uniref:Fatty acid desaturase-domain-containing protein n=1 Tax=Pseudomassariella vexata TaxID=1141098 RepID=A0A1Y2DTA8_9PEZI|nr:fatty acid desaturase-domain-containing protein [Pseudomassariella vexata]ORY62487.1 fatty acid desaturase-domain-containing protein [Pseudomassariella vexata]
MKAYRIARKPDGPWLNMTPPIRGGVYRPTDTSTDNSDCDDEESSLASSSSSCGDRSSSPSDSTSVTSDCTTVSVDSLVEKVQDEAIIRRRIPSKIVPNHHPTNIAATPSLTRDEYTELAIQQEINDCIKEYPSVDPAVQQDIVRKYRVLHQRVQDEGFYDCPYLEYGKEMARYTTLLVASMTALHFGWYMTSAVFLGLFWHQIMFSAHDAGHGAITHNFKIDTLIGLFVADFCCGLSMGWWKSSHNVHHLITNHPEHDPDIQNVPIFATCPSFFKSIKSSYYDNFVFLWDATAEFLVPYQHYTYYPIMGVARFNLYLLSWLHVLSRKSSSLGGSKAWWIRPTEIVFMICFWFIFGYCLLWRALPTWTIRVAFVLVSHFVTMPLHVQITLSHWGMSTSDLGESESFPQRQLRTTMDVDCPAWLDFIHGGLQFQAVHHLFPRVPRHNLRRLQVLVREFCKETNIPYAILSFADGNRKVLGRLEEVGEQVRFLVTCQKYMAETGESGLH